MSTIVDRRPQRAASPGAAWPLVEWCRAAPRRDWRVLLATLVIVDTLALSLAVGIAGVLRAGLDDRLPVSTLATDRHLVASVLVVPILLLMFRIQGLYEGEQILVGTREYARIAHGASYGVLCVLAVSYFAGGGPLVSRTWILLVWMLGIGCAGAGRFLTRRVVRRLRQQGAFRTRVLIVGASPAGLAIGEQLSNAKGEGLDLVGFLDEYLPLGQTLLPGVAVVGRPGDLTRAPAPDLADEYIIVPQAIPHERLEELTRLMIARRDAVLRLAVTSRDLLAHGMQVTDRGGVPLVALRRARLAGLEAALKRGLDLVGAGLALVLLAPLVAGALARASLAGVRPLLYRQSIRGGAGRPIQFWLLSAGTRAWLPVRGVPALLAVLTGHLSLVGPRPTCWSPDSSARTPSWLTALKPGLTGPWRLSGPHASLADQELEDLAYVRNYTLWEDLRILWESVRLVRRDPRGLLLGRWQAEAPAACAPVAAGPGGY